MANEVINKKYLVEALAKEYGVTKKDATEYVNFIFTTISTKMKKNKVDISGFGKFEVKKRKARKGINPATKEQIKIPATKVPSFKAAKALKELVK